jgi:hypothetical protein
VFALTEAGTLAVLSALRHAVLGEHPLPLSEARRTVMAASGELVKGIQFWRNAIEIDDGVRASPPSILALGHGPRDPLSLTDTLASGSPMVIMVLCARHPWLTRRPTFRSSSTRPSIAGSASSSSGTENLQPPSCPSRSRYRRSLAGLRG